MLGLLRALTLTALNKLRCSAQQRAQVQPIESGAFNRRDPHGCMQAEPVDVSTQGLPSRNVPRHRAAQAQHLLPGAGPKDDAVDTSIS